MKLDSLQSWGRLVGAKRRSISPDAYEDARLGAEPESFLPFGNGRSYGDSCHNDAGTLIANRARDRILSFDPGTGLISCEAGVTLAEILARAVQSRFFLAVTPGTAFATVGGAVANDVHGKNHHARGSFGKHVVNLTLLRSTGDVLTCSRQENSDLFKATIGGMGLTGLIVTVQLQLMKVPCAHIQQHTTRFDTLSDYFALIDDTDASHEYSVAWVDQLAGGKTLGRGVLLAGDHADGSCDLPDGPRKSRLSVPFQPPFNLLNAVSMKVFNEVYFRKVPRHETVTTVPWSSYFYPLDAIRGWNRLYGPAGLFQHQSVYPAADAEAVTRLLLTEAKNAGHASFLTVLKKFGDSPPAGMLSFARPGFTLTLDFANQGKSTLNLLNRLDDIVLDAGGAVNPYKDARMSARTFAASFPNWQKLEVLRDPVMMSDFWRRTAMQLSR